MAIESMKRIILFPMLLLTTCLFSQQIIGDFLWEECVKVEKAYNHQTAAVVLGLMVGKISKKYHPLEQLTTNLRDNYLKDITILSINASSLLRDGYLPHTIFAIMCLGDSSLDYNLIIDSYECFLLTRK